MSLLHLIAGCALLRIGRLVWRLEHGVHIFYLLQKACTARSCAWARSPPPGLPAPTATQAAPMTKQAAFTVAPAASHRSASACVRSGAARQVCLPPLLLAGRRC